VSADDELLVEGGSLTEFIIKNRLARKEKIPKNYIQIIKIELNPRETQEW
jgi:hypothetical protein